MSYELTVICASMDELKKVIAQLEITRTTSPAAEKTDKPKTAAAAKKGIKITEQKEVEEVEEVEEAEYELIPEGQIIESKHNKSDVSAALRQLMNTIDRAAVTQVLKMCKVEKVSQIPESMYQEVMEHVANKLKEHENSSESMFDEEDETEVDDEVAEVEETPTVLMMKGIAKKMNAESRIDYRKLLGKYKCGDARSFPNLTDEDKKLMFAEMNEFLGAI